MKKLFRKYQNFFLLLALPLSACAWLWLKSEPPPYGTPLNELSDQYWGILMDIARQWKTGNFSFWTRSIGGGFCLYTSGFYPLWVPWNFLAKFLSYEHFYIFKLVEPYFIGLFSMMLLLRHGLRLSYPLAAFGALAYMGCVFTRYVGIIHYPFFLWALALFPLILFVYLRLFEKHIYLRGMILGGFLALVFLGGGAGQYVQMIIWGLILIVSDAFFFMKGKSLWQRLMLAIASCAIFIIFAFILVGNQILPMTVYTLAESSRTLGEYPINNFPFFRNDYKGTVSISKILGISIMADGDPGVRAFWALMIFTVGKLIVDWKVFRQWCDTHKALMNVALTTVLFFLFPPIAELLSHISPVFAKLFNPLRMFTFGYCGFMIDMIVVVLMVVLLSFRTQTKPWKQIVLLTAVLIAGIYMFAPLLIKQLFPHLQIQYVFIHYSQRYLAMMVLLLLTLPWPRARTAQTIIASVALLFIGIQLVQTSYVWGEKGRQNAHEEYALDTPEHNFYRSMAGHYYLPFVHLDGTRDSHVSMTHNYDLLYGIDGLQGFLNVPPKRLSNFINAFHNQIYWTKNTPAYKFSWRLTPASFTTYFPIEFTTIRKGQILPWPGFSKKINGDYYDAWVRDEPPAPVRFAKEIKVVSYRELVDSFDRAYEGIIYMTQEDAARYSPPILEMVPILKETAYCNFQRKSSDVWTFDVESPEEIYVVLPEMFQSGWRLKVDNKVQSLFPASSLFIGFFLEKGKHDIELEFRPVLWEAGWLLTLLGVSLFGWILYKNLRKRKKRS